VGVKRSEVVDGTAGSAEDGKRALRQWARHAQMLAAALEKLVAVAQDDALLLDDEARRYTVSCTSL